MFQHVRIAMSCAALLLLAACGGSSAPQSGATRSSGDSHCDASRPSIAQHASGASATAEALIPCRYGTGTRAMEPSFAFAPNDTILFQGWVLRDSVPGGVPPYPVVSRSRDGGASWQDASPTGPITSLDPFMVGDPRTGRVFSLNFLSDGQPLGATLAYTDDGGDHWTLSPLAGTGFDGESIGVGPPVSSATIGYPDLVYYCTGTTPASSPPLTTPVCSKSIDGGLSFVPTGTLPFKLASGSDEFGPWAGNPVVGPDGTLYLPKRQDGQPQLAISVDEGLNWHVVAVAANGSSGAATRLAVDDAGNVYYTWAGADHRPYVAYSRDRGEHWSAPIALAPHGLVEAALPRIAVAAPGRVAVAYLGSTNAPGQAPYFAYCNVLLSMCDEGAYANATWNGYLAEIDDLFAADPLIRTASVNDPAQPLFVGGCSPDGACMADLDFIDVHFDAHGTPWGAFVDDCEWARGFVAVLTPNTPQCGDNVGEGILVKLVPAAR
jgi:hypothetical protein